MKITAEFFTFVTFAWLTFVPVALAQPTESTTWSVEFSGPCSEVPGFEEAVRAAIPQEARRPPAAAEMQLRVHTQLSPGSRAEVDVYDTILEAPAGSRAISSQRPGCAQLQDQLTLVVGILVEAGRGAPVERPPEPAPPPPSAPPEPRRQGFEVRKPPRRPVRVGPPRSLKLGAVATAGWGLLPGAYPGTELRWSVTSRAGVPFRLAGQFDGPGTATLNPGRAKAFSGRLVLGVCPEWPWGSVRVGVCGLVGLGATRVRSFGLEDNRRQRRPAFVVGAEGFVAVPLAGPAELVVGMQALGIPYRPKFVYMEQDGNRSLAFQSAPVAIRGHGGLQLRFR